MILLLFFGCCWFLLLLLCFFFPRCLSISLVHIPYSTSSCYTIKKQFHVRSAVFLQVHLVLLTRVLIQICILLKLYFSKIYLYFINTFLRNLLKFLRIKKRHHAQATSKWSFIDVTIQLLKLYLELTIYRCINDEHTPKNGDFNKKTKTMKAYFKVVLLLL